MTLPTAPQVLGGALAVYAALNTVAAIVSGPWPERRRHIFAALAYALIAALIFWRSPNV